MGNPGKQNAGTGKSQPELDEVVSALYQLVTDYQSWRFSLGRFQVKRALSSMHFFAVFVIFNISLGIGGIILIFDRDPLRTIGISVLVGSIFSFGTFLTEVWSQSVDKEARLFEMNGGKRLEKMFADLEARYLALVSEDHPEELTDPYAAMYAVMARAQTGKQDRKKRSSLARRAWEKISLVVPGHWAGRHPDDPLAVVEEHQQAPDGDGCG